MRKLLLIIVSVLALSSPSFAQTTPTAVLTGTATSIIGPSGTIYPVALQAQLVGCQQQVPVVPGGSIVQTLFTQSAPGPAYSASITAFGNDIITCGTQNYTTYAVTWLINGQPAAPTATYRLTQGQTCNISNGTCKPINFVPAVISKGAGLFCAAGQILNGFNADYTPNCQAFAGGLIPPFLTNSVLNSVQSSLNLTGANGITLSALGPIVTVDGSALVRLSPLVGQTITQPSATSLNVVTSGGGQLQYNGSQVLTSASLTGLISSTPVATQTITQPAGTTFSVNNFNFTKYAQNGDNIGTLCTGFNGKIIVSFPLNVTTTTILPSTCEIEVLQGGSLNISAGQYLQIGGPFKAGLFQAFLGAGAVYFQGSSSNTGILPQWFGATGNGKASGFSSIASNATVTLSGFLFNFSIGDSVTMIGAGSGGTNLQTTVTGTPTGSTLTVSPVPLTTVSSSAIYTEDDSFALNRWTASVRGNVQLSAFYDNRSGFGPGKLYMPKGNYPVCSTSVMVFASTVMEAEQGQTNTGASFTQCNPNFPVLKISPNGYTPSGTLINYGNGNSFFTNIKFTGAYNFGTETPATVQYINSGNVHSDNRWTHPMFESIGGSAFTMGFATTNVGTAGIGTTTITLRDGSTFCTSAFAAALSQPCNQIIIVGAGTAGANLTANIITGVPDPPVATPSGQQYTVTISTPIITAVTNTAIYAGSDINNTLTIEHAELDGGRFFLKAQGNASGSVVIDHAEIFNSNNGGLRNTSLSSVDLEFTHSLCQGCGVTGGASLDTRAISWINGLGTLQTGTIRIESNTFAHLTITGVNEGGPIAVSGSRDTIISKNVFYSPDTTDNIKAIGVLNSRITDITDNQIFWDNTFTGAWGSSQAIETNNTIQTPLVHISGNSILNNSGTTLVTGIQGDDSNTSGYAVIGNLFSGTSAITTQLSTNILNQDQRNILISQDHVIKWGTTFPVAGTWKQGDVMINNHPGSGQPSAWACSVAGTPGTWVPLANIP